MNDIRRIMVVATNIRHSRGTVHYGVSLAKKYDAELVVLHVEHDPFGEDGWKIGKVVEEEKIDLLLMPAHEENRLEHFLFGRINEAIIRRLPCSVLLVKQPSVA